MEIDNYYSFFCHPDPLAMKGKGFGVSCNLEILHSVCNDTSCQFRFMIIFIYGEDTFRSHEKLDYFKEKFKKDVDKSGGNIFIFDEENADLDKLKSVFFTRSFLARKKMVILKKASKFKKNIVDEINNWFEKLRENTDLILIFWEETGDNNRKKKDSDLISKLKKIKYTYEFPLVLDHNLEQWIKERVSAEGGKINREAIDLLSIYVGNNLWQMEKEIGKLAAYKNKEVITAEDVELLTKAKLEENIFRFIDAIESRDTKLAIKLINEQVESGVEINHLLSLIIRQFRILLQVKDCLNNKTSPLKLATQLKVHPFVIKKAASQSQKYSFEELKKIYRHLLEIDLRSKTGENNNQVLLDLFIVEKLIA